MNGLRTAIGAEAIHFAAATTLIIHFAIYGKLSAFGIANLSMHLVGFSCILMETFNGTNSAVTVLMSVVVTIWEIAIMVLVVNHLPFSIA